MAGISTSFSIQDRMTRTFDRMSGANERLNRTLATTDRMTNTIDLDNVFQGVASMIDDAANRVENLNQRQRQAESGANGIKRTWDKVRNAVQGVMAALAVNKIMDLADSMTNTRARLDLMNDGLQTTAELQDMIMASANRSRASYQATADAVAKLGTNAKDAFSSSKELVAFSELVNKTFTISGATAEEQKNAMLQLTQAMSSGVLRGDELRSIFEQAPVLVQKIAEYLDAPIGKIRKMAADGEITAEIVKNAMFAASDDINSKFASMPMTFAQVWTIAKNIALEAFTPVLQLIGQGAQWIYDNWSTIAPIFWGLAAAVGAFALITGVWTAVTWLQVAANRALLASMLTNPILWVAIVIGLVIGLIYQWVQSVGGLKVAWLMAMNLIKTAFDWTCIGIMTGVYWVMSLFNRLQLTFATVSTNIQNFMGDMKAGVLMILQNMVNGAIDIINGFINLLNKIPGVSIDLIDQMTFGTTAQLENEANKQARAADLAAYQDQINSQIAERDAALDAMKAEARAATAQRDAEIAAARAEAAAVGNKNDEPDWAAYADAARNVDHVGSVGSVDEDVNIAEEDLKFLRDVAEMRYVQNNMTLTPQVILEGVQISEKVDVDEVVTRIENKLETEFEAAAEGVYA